MPSFPSDVDTDVAAMYIAWDFAVRGSGKNSDDLPYLLDLYEIAFRRVVMLHDEAFGEEEDDEEEDEEIAQQATMTNLPHPDEH